MNGPGLKTMDQTPQVLILHRLSLINTMTEHKKLIKDIPLPKENWNACNDPQHNVLKTMLSIPFDDATGVIYFFDFIVLISNSILGCVCIYFLGLFSS